jgi:hypothetical protein
MRPPALSCPPTRACSSRAGGPSPASRALPLATAALGLALTGLGCQEAPRPSSFLRVELMPSPDTMPRASRVVISKGGATLATLCVRVDGSSQAAPASVVLERKATDDAATPVTIEVTSYDAVAGHDTVGPGEEFPCPGTLPPLVGDEQRLTLPLCAATSRAVSFHVGASCASPCGASQVCGAGLSSTGAECAETTCCSATLDACALPAAE